MSDLIVDIQNHNICLLIQDLVNLKHPILVDEW